MIGTLPMVALAPLDYRYALDATMTVLAGRGTPLIICNIAELGGEIRQRLPRWSTTQPAPAALWIEPQAPTWTAELATLAAALAPGAPLVIIASRPLARLLPERRAWQGQPLGLSIGGVNRLRAELPQAKFRLQTIQGIHSVVSIGMSVLSLVAEHIGRLEVADRLHFAARLHYRTTGSLALGATVALLIAQKERV